LKEVEPSEELNNNKDLSQCRLLLVEDNRINQEVARHILAELGIEPDIATNGLEALTLLKAAKGSAAYNIILMDCQMPEMDGYQATTAIRQGQAGSENQAITIIAMTANAMKGDKEKCLAVGMTDYLSKPIEPVKLKEKLSLYIGAEIRNDNKIHITSEVKVKQSEQVKYIESNIVGHAQTSPDEIQEEQQFETWQRNEFSKRLNNNEGIQQKLIALFLDETPKQLNALALSISQHDNTLQHEISHKIQGMTANLNAEELLHHTKNFNSYVKTPTPEDIKVEELFQMMTISYQKLEQVLNEKITES
jgi:CheY-like chemotaxis protein